MWRGGEWVEIHVICPLCLSSVDSLTFFAVTLAFDNLLPLPPRHPSTSLPRSKRIVYDYKQSYTTIPLMP